MTGDRIAIVGAASGMGAAIFARLRAGGAAVVGLDLADARWPDDAPVTRFAVDVADHGSVRAAIDAATANLGGLDVVINCAGTLGPVEPTLAAAPETIQRILAVNLGGAFAVTQAALAHLLPTGYGRIVHIASIAGKEGNPEMAAYSASKAGVIGMVKAVGKEYADSGVTINAIAPAAIDTPLLAGLSDEQRAERAAIIPMGRMGTVGEVAALVEYVVSREASFTTGFVYDLSGGRASY
ncbi:SDR family NAD(P)-dependent oxidoreductase [Agrococcus sp. ARC_14]|uniref:SDR family NAD(P)-dependent oxidoreductase n=1 Tax=Agrococcus sp. ARC_14 TaxID=2919927 RepID=UPI001F054521|nr:SDR family oxidoreductase [Agrococcus sp. ARC_14]